VSAGRAAVLRPGDWVVFDGGEHQVVGFAGISVRLRSVDGTEQVVLGTYLMASPGFAVTGGAPPPEVEPFGLLERLPEPVLEAARDWVEVQTGLPRDAGPGMVPRPGFDPATTAVAQRDQAKAAELGVSVRTVQQRRGRYARQGLWGLVDGRAVRTWEATGRVDARVVAAVREVINAETGTSTGTRSRLIQRAVAAVEAGHGPGVVPLPGRSTFYKLIEVLATGRHTFGSAITRRQTANRPRAMFTVSHAMRPGEQVQIDSTPIDVLVLLDTGVPARADLTIAVDVATRTLCAAVLRPVGTKAVDAALLLARMLVPEPMRPAHGAYAGLLGRGHPERDPGGRVEALAAASAADLLQAAARRLARPCTQAQRSGRAEREVVGVAEGADLLILARDGDRSHLRPKSLGPASRFALADHAPCPVLLVWAGPPPAAGGLPPAPPHPPRHRPGRR
jgi:putative transposase